MGNTAQVAVDLETIVNAVRDVVRTEISRFFFELLEDVDDEEQDWIERTAGTPSEYREEDFEEI